MGRIGFWEIIFVFLVILLLFGARRLPEIGSAIGKAIKEFQKAIKGAEDNQSQNPSKPDEKKLS